MMFACDGVRDVAQWAEDVYNITPELEIMVTIYVGCISDGWIESMPYLP